MTKQKKDKVLLLADYFVKKSEEEPEKRLDAKKLQKLLYYSQAWSLVLRNEELFPDKIEAWIHGPAIYTVWKNFNSFNFNSPHPEIDREDFSDISEDEKKLLDKVWTVYGKFDGNYLETLAHNELPWQQARKEVGSEELSRNIITNESMKSYYGERLREILSKDTQDSKGKTS